MSIYSDRIRPLFQASNLNAAQLETAIGLPPGKISDWERGRTKSYDRYINKIASYFGVSTDYLLGNTDEPTPSDEGGLAVINWLRALPPEKRQAILALGDAPADVTALFSSETSR